jgi:hypothetical protein
MTTGAQSMVVDLVVTGISWAGQRLRKAKKSIRQNLNIKQAKV